MNTSIVRVVSAVVVMLAVASWASAITILPNDDTYLDQVNANSVRDYPSLQPSAGILMKGQSSNVRIGIIEFTLPNVEVTSATFNMLHIRSWAAGTSWTLRGWAKVADFDENTITWSNSPGVGDTGTGTGAVRIGTDLTMPGGNSGQDVSPPQWRNLDMTSFFNDHRGETITVVLKCTSTGSSQGGTIEDREGSRTGNPANSPYIDYVPEPAVGLLLVLGSLGLLRRRPI